MKKKKNDDLNKHATAGSMTVQPTVAESAPLSGNESWKPAADAREQVRRWDAGETIWSIDMGGMGPGYEQAIQVLAVEITRDNFDKIPTEAEWREFGDSTITRVDAQGPDGKYSCGGFSGAQVGAAKWLAYQWLKDGPRTLHQNKKYEDRHIQVSNFWPKAPSAGCGH